MDDLIYISAQGKDINLNDEIFTSPETKLHPIMILKCLFWQAYTARWNF